MPRTVKPEAFAAKRGEILDVTQRLVFTRGFAQVAIRDILNELDISSGAFHHYFNSRADLLDALIERIKTTVEAQLLPIIHDPRLTALEKLQGFFDTLDRLRIAQKAVIIELSRVWYTDDNAVVRLRVEEAVFAQRAPLLAEIVRQGVREGSFTTAYPDQAGELVLSLLQGMGNSTAQLFLALAESSQIADYVERIVALDAACLDAIERVLGAPPGSLRRTNSDAVASWLTALQAEHQGEGRKKD